MIQLAHTRGNSMCYRGKHWQIKFRACRTVEMWSTWGYSCNSRPCKCVLVEWGRGGAILSGATLKKTVSRVCQSRLTRQTLAGSVAVRPALRLAESGGADESRPAIGRSSSRQPTRTTSPPLLLLRGAREERGRMREETARLIRR